MIAYPIEIGTQAIASLRKILSEKQYSQILVLMDDNTAEHCYPKIEEGLPDHHKLVIPPGELFKNLDSCKQIWEKMTEWRFDRRAVVINLGGGVIGDMGGFVASTYKRGIDFIQLPTTLLAQVDASVGGKLGIDFESFKNHIGVFKEPVGVYIFPEFLKSLPRRQLLSGFAEVVKHHLIADKAAWETLSSSKLDIAQLDFDSLIAHSVDIKARIVEEDPFESGARKALNFGHTIGHAIESLALQEEKWPELLHGEAIAIGMIAEAYISRQRALISQEEFTLIDQYLRHTYGHYEFPEQAFEKIYHLSLQDKKNQSGKILCTLIDGVGGFKVNQAITKDEIFGGLTHYLYHPLMA